MVSNDGSSGIVGFPCSILSLLSSTSVEISEAAFETSDTLGSSSASFETGAETEGDNGTETPSLTSFAGVGTGVEVGVVDVSEASSLISFVRVALNTDPSFTGSWPPLFNRSLNDFVPDPAKALNPPPPANVLNAPVAGVGGVVVTVVVMVPVVVVVGGNAGVPKTLFGVVPGIDGAPNVGAAALGFVGVVNAAGVLLKAKALTGLDSVCLGEKKGDSLGMPPKNPVAGLVVVPFRTSPEPNDAVGVAAFGDVVGGDGDGRPPTGDGDLLSGCRKGLSRAAKSDDGSAVVGLVCSPVIRTGSALASAGSGAVASGLVVDGPNTALDFSGAFFWSSEIAHTGFETLLANAANPVAPSVANAPNAPPLVGVAGASGGPLVVDGDPKDDFPNANPPEPTV